MNTYKKFAPNVFVAKCEDEYKKGNRITVTTKRGKENECVVFNKVAEKDGFNYYSIIRADGFNYQEWAKRKAEKHQSWANSSIRKSNEKLEESNEGKEFLTLGEPIKVGHHSEKRHRALIERNHRRMEKSVEFRDKAEEHSKKAEYWKSRAGEINLSMPESLDYYSIKLDEAKKRHQFLKKNPKKRPHSYSLTYAKKDVNNLTKKVELAEKLWGE